MWTLRLLFEAYLIARRLKNRTNSKREHDALAGSYYKNSMNSIGYVWFPENIKERKKNAKENDFFIFGYPMKNIKENQI